MGAIESSVIRRVFSLAASLKNPIDLSIGKPDFDVPSEVKEEAIKAIKEGRNAYTPTQGIEKLREGIAEKLRGKNKIGEAKADKVIVTSGVAGGLFLAFAALLEKGDEIIVVDPDFLVYEQLSGFFGATPVLVDSYPNFKLPLEEISEKISKKTKAIIFSSPSNPSGAMQSEGDLRKLAKIASENETLLISDEIYEEYWYEKKPFSVGSVYENTLTLNGFSKSVSMTGWRVGYAHGPSELIGEMNKLQPYTFVCAPSFAQWACVKALDFDFSEKRREYKGKRDLVCRGLKKNFEFVEPKGAFYLFPEAPGGNGNAFVEKGIREKELLAVPGKVFSRKNTHFRISFANKDETLERGVQALNDLAQGF
jgi:aspartate aminotransferase/aminotransferase